MSHSARLSVLHRAEHVAFGILEEHQRPDADDDRPRHHRLAAIGEDGLLDVVEKDPVSNELTPERWQQVKAALVVALELPPGSRDAYWMRSAQATNCFAMRSIALLMAEAMAGPQFLARPLLLPDLNERAQPELDPWIGRRLGTYEVVEQIGVGGMGEVYRAFRADDQYRKPGRHQTGSRWPGLGVSSSAGSRTERQILASLDHSKHRDDPARRRTPPKTGLPYFVMELIEGRADRSSIATITRNLHVTERLKLFLQVCSAVQYAHQRSDIHRDIKPSNILVTAEGVPKLLDFGIAKIVDPDACRKKRGAHGDHGGWLTPDYASPEQIKGEAITTASDVFSLGLVLYQLLTRHQAYRLEGRTPHEMARAVIETEPRKPSAAVRRVGPDLVSWRGDSPEKLQRRLAGDLDNIVMKAIRKDPRERYDSVDHLSEDLRRHLEGRPVTARKSTIGYRCRKFVSRHIAGVIAAALVLLSLISGIVVTLREARIARMNEIRAEKRFNDVRKLASSLIFEIHDSIKDLAGATPTRKLLVERALEYPGWPGAGSRRRSILAAGACQSVRKTGRRSRKR